MDGRRLGNTVLGEIVKDVWGDKVEKAYRGPRGQRQRVYVNLGRRQPAEEINRTALTDTVTYWRNSPISLFLVGGRWSLTTQIPSPLFVWSLGK